MATRPIRYDAGARNVLGAELVPCSLDPVTGFFRNGCCETGPHDVGMDLRTVPDAVNLKKA